jgi:hypothetical protein
MLDAKKNNHILWRRVNMIDHYNKNPTLDHQKVRLMLKQNKITRISWLLAIVFVVSCLKYQPPENLRLLLEMDGYTLYCPVWSPAGKIYFLTVGEEYGSSNFGGSLWVCDTSGKDARLLLDRKFGHLAISTDGSRLALTYGKLISGGPLIIVDTAGNLIDTISTSEPMVVSARFSFDGNKIYYYALGGDSNGFYRKNIDNTNEEFLMGENYPTFFDVSVGGRIIKDPYGDAVCDLSPIDSNLLIEGRIPFSGYGTGERLILWNIATSTDSDFIVKPYKDTDASFPYWSPEGNKIVFTAASKEGFEGWPGYGSLWILDLTEGK